MRIGEIVFETLIALDENLNYVPRLATSWEKKDDLTWIFNLRKGVKFTDGTPFNAEAVKINLERSSKSVKGKTSLFMLSIVNILDDYKIEIKLKQPSAPFFPNLTNITTAMMSPAAIEKYGDELFQNPVGTGMFKLEKEEWKPGTQVVFTRNEDYWGTPAKLEKLIFIPIPNEASRTMALKSGDVDIIENLPAFEVPSMEEDPNFKLLIVPQLKTVWVGFNCEDAVLKDPKVRRAIAHAIDRESILKYTMAGLSRSAAPGFLPPELMKTDPPLSLNYDPELSRKLLAEAGYEDGLKLQLLSPEGRYPKDLEIAQVVQEQLKNVGIDVSIITTEFGSFIDTLIRHETQMFIIGWTIEKHPDSVFRACFYGKTLTTNYANYRNEEMDKLMDETTRLGDEEESNQNYYKIVKTLVVDDAVIFPLYYINMIYGLNSKVEEFSVLPTQFWGFSKTWIRD